MWSSPTVDQTRDFPALDPITKIRPEDVGQYLQPLLDAFHVKEVDLLAVGIFIPAHWAVHEVPADAQDGTRGMTLVATGWKLEENGNSILAESNGTEVLASN